MLELKKIIIKLFLYKKFKNFGFYVVIIKQKTFLLFIMNLKLNIKKICKNLRKFSKI